MTEKKPTRPTRRPSGLVREIRSLLPQCMLQDRVRIERKLEGLQRRTRRDPDALRRLKNQASKSAALLRKRRRRRPRISYPESLPITAKRAEILDAVRQHPVVI
ncbi:MAG: hypothetical protein QGI83_02515, partial [Candidatus Latescibacteria bacterium]|nr:hypothetical protein [Candidatus Latescibacterota bacterium]